MSIINTEIFISINNRSAQSISSNTCLRRILVVAFPALQFSIKQLEFLSKPELKIGIPIVLQPKHWATNKSLYFQLLTRKAVVDEELFQMKKNLEICLSRSIGNDADWLTTPMNFRKLWSKKLAKMCVDLSNKSLIAYQHKVIVSIGQMYRPLVLSTYFGNFVFSDS